MGDLNQTIDDLMKRCGEAGVDEILSLQRCSFGATVKPTHGTNNR